MLTQCHYGRQRSEAELAALLDSAALRRDTVRGTAGPAQVERVA
jgi:hypothetical protein